MTFHSSPPRAEFKNPRRTTSTSTHIHDALLIELQGQIYDQKNSNSQHNKIRYYRIMDHEGAKDRACAVLTVYMRLVFGRIISRAKKLTESACQHLKTKTIYVKIKNNFF